MSIKTSMSRSAADDLRFKRDQKASQALNSLIESEQQKAAERAKQNKVVESSALFLKKSPVALLREQEQQFASRCNAAFCEFMTSVVVESKPLGEDFNYKGKMEAAILEFFNTMVEGKHVNPFKMVGRTAPGTKLMMLLSETVSFQDMADNGVEVSEGDKQYIQESIVEIHRPLTEMVAAKTRMALAEQIKRKREVQAIQESTSFVTPAVRAEIAKKTLIESLTTYNVKPLIATLTESSEEKQTEIMESALADSLIQYACLEAMHTIGCFVPQTTNSVRAFGNAIATLKK